MRLKDQVVLITGASRGIGAGCAVAAAKEGAKLVLAAKTVDPDPRLPGTLLETQAACEALGAETLVVPFDARSAEQCQMVVEKAIEKFGRVDVLINNAGAIFWAPVADWSVKKFDLVVGINVRASFVLANAVIPHMRRQGGGHILMMSPPVVAAGAIGKAPYAVSKFGMTLLAQAIDAEEKANGIAGSALWPVAAIRTAATENLGIGDLSKWRTPDVLVDATMELITRDPRTLSFRAWLDEELLAEAGVTDFTKYRCVPDVEPPPVSIELIDPGWGARHGRS